MSGHVLGNVTGVLGAALEEALTKQFTSKDKDLLLFFSLWPYYNSPAGRFGHEEKGWRNNVTLAIMDKTGQEVRMTPPGMEFPSPFHTGILIPEWLEAGRIKIPVKQTTQYESRRSGGREWSKSLFRTESDSIQEWGFPLGDYARGWLIEQSGNKLPPHEGSKDALGVLTKISSLVWLHCEIEEMLLNGDGAIPLLCNYTLDLSTFVKMLSELRGEDDLFLAKLKARESEFKKNLEGALETVKKAREGGAVPIEKITAAIRNIRRISKVLGEEIPRDLPDENTPLNKLTSLS